MQENTAQFSLFLSHAISQKEVSLVIARDEKENTAFEKILTENGFQEAKTSFELLEKARTRVKTYLNLNDNFSKQVYDFLTQYPTGQIELFDNEQMGSKVVFPAYENGAVVFLVSKNNLLEIEKKGFRIREAVGMAYQS